MFKYGSFRNFVVKLFIGIILFGFGTIYLASLYTYSLDDPGYQLNYNFNEDEVKNILGLFGAYLSSYSFVFVGTLSYLFALFLTVEGGRFFLGISSRLVILRFLSILLGIMFVNMSLRTVDDTYLEKGLLSQFVLDLFSTINLNFLDNIFMIKFSILL